MSKNEQVSSLMCEERLQHLSQRLFEKISTGDYAVPWGYPTFLDDIGEIRQTYVEELLGPKVSDQIIDSDVTAVCNHQYTI